MKRLLILVSVMLFMFGLGGCGAADSATLKSEQVVKENTEKSESTDTIESEAGQPVNTVDESKSNDAADNSEEEIRQSLLI